MTPKALSRVITKYNPLTKKYIAVKLEDNLSEEVIEYADLLLTKENKHL